jgi:hypothetical protein
VVRTLIGGALTGVLLTNIGCSLLQGYGYCDAVPPARLAQAPSALSATGLFTDMASEQLAEGVVPYRPRFELWSDGATKRRWVYLPPGTKIDTSDMDAWQFPEGTKFWKEFTRDGVRVETRLLHKVGRAPHDWVTVAYVWDVGGHDAMAAPAGTENANGTPHDVPAARSCMGCHGGTASRVLGFSAIQLADDLADSEMSLARLEREGRLTHPAPGAIRVPGDPTTQKALGYLHANCAHCHNQHRPSATGARCFDPQRTFDLSLRVDRLERLEVTPVYATTIGSVVTAGDPDASKVFQRITGSSVFEPRMPALGTETVDPAGVALLRSWIGGMKR